MFSFMPPVLPGLAMAGLAMAGLAMAGLAVAGPPGFARTSSAATVPAAGTSTAVLGCERKPEIRPGNFTLACADDNSYLTALHWTSWTGQRATATGTQELNDCVPYCAEGHFRGYPVHVILWDAAAVADTQAYQRITLTYPGTRPDIPGLPGRELPASVTNNLSAAGYRNPDGLLWL
jgi:hypothetical protein